MRFTPDSVEFRVLSGWIADGAPPPSDSDARIVRIEVVPPQVTLKPGDEHAMMVKAHFSDGSEAKGSVAAFNGLSASDRQDILNFLRSL